MLNKLKDFFRRWYLRRYYSLDIDAYCWWNASNHSDDRLAWIAHHIGLDDKWHPYIQELIDEWRWKHGILRISESKTETESEALGKPLAQAAEPVLEGGPDGGIIVVGHEVVGTYGKGEFFPDATCDSPGCCEGHGEQPCSMETAPVDGHSPEDAERSKEARKISPTRVRSRRRRACRKGDRGVA